jgi:hypothetical protein
MPKKPKVSNLQKQLSKQMVQLLKAQDKLADMLGDDIPDDPAVIADLEQAIADHQANVDRITQKIGV